MLFIMAKAAPHRHPEAGSQAQSLQPALRVTPREVRQSGSRLRVARPRAARSVRSGGLAAWGVRWWAALQIAGAAMTNATLLPLQPDAMTPAQLAAVSYLARYTGHTHTL